MSGLLQMVKDGAPQAAPTTPQAPSAPANEPPTPQIALDVPEPDWGALNNDLDGVDTDEPPVDDKTPPVETPAEPAQIQPAAEPVQPAVATEPQAPATPQEPQVPATPETPALTPDEQKARIDAVRAQLEKMYEFDADTALLLQTEPEKVLPKLAAKLHLDVMQMVQASLQQTIPQVIQNQQEVSARNEKAKKQFYDAWPQLVGHEQQVMQIGVMFRQMNPNATAEEAVKRIGEITLASLGTPAAPTATPTAPTASATPHVPAGAGRLGSPPSSAPTVWDDMSADDD